MVNNRKKFSDFRDPDDNSKPLFSKEELEKTLIIDDQYCAIFDKEHLVMSKKFLQFSDIVPYAPPQRKIHWQNYQYPYRNEQQHRVIERDLSRAHQVSISPQLDICVGTQQSWRGQPALLHQ